MCIIIAKEKGKRLPTNEELLNSFEFNNDGAGFMYVKNGKVVVDKGYMTLSSFINRYNQLCKEFNDFKNKSLVIHCRIGTSSGNTDKNTHPYPITNKEKKLHKTYFETDLGMAHNGIIHDYTPTSKAPTTNDTQEFIMKYVYPIYKNYKDFYKNKYIREGMEVITNSKLVFLDTDDNLYYVGDFIEDDGLKFSNTSYRSYRYTYSNYNKTYTSKYDYYLNDDKEYNTSGDIYDDKLDTYYDYYLDDEIDDYSTKMYLDKEWLLEMNGHIEKVGDRDLVWDYQTSEVFKLSDNNTLIKLYNNVYVYDENFEEIV